MKVIYRISDAGYNKVKPAYINNEACLKNATEKFKDCEWLIIADNCSIETMSMIYKYHTKESVIQVTVGNGAGTFNIALEKALLYESGEIVYFLENDYLHKENASTILREGFEIGADFVTLYDHPDKYIPALSGGNLYIEEDGGEVTKIYLSKSSHWKITNSTTMTFAAKVSTLKRTEHILKKHTSEKYPEDFKMFLELRQENNILLSSIPGYSTHGETAWLSPLNDWSKV